MTTAEENSNREDHPLNTPTPTLLKPEQVAAILGVSRGHLANERSAGKGIRYVKLGSAVRYRSDDVAAHIAANTVHPWAVGA